MTEFAKAYDREAALRFPLLPSAHDLTVWRYIFDWTVAGEALHCTPGDLVLEFGSGTSYASEFLNRVGYRTVALDLDLEMLSLARERMGLDSRLTPQRASYATGDGQRLPFADASFDGVICLNALHHMPDYTAALSEIRRILKPGARATFSEPGSRHADSPESRLAREQFGAVEKSVFLDEIYRIARNSGFETMYVKPQVYPDMVQLDYGKLNRYRFNLSTASYTRPDQIARFLEESHSVFILQMPGQSARTSRRPGALRASISVGALPAQARPGQEIAVHAVVTNTGDTLWLAQPRELGGFVTLGVKLCQADGRLLSDSLGRTPLDHDVAAGEKIEVACVFSLPKAISSDNYLLRIDMVDEQVAWFEQHSSPVVEHRFSVLA
jgi:ubiquinone/menaquinone biosynthesis C-methylase UbiE